MFFDATRTRSAYLADISREIKTHLVARIALLPHLSFAGELSNGGGSGRLVDKL